MKARVISRKKLLCSTARADLLCAGCRLFCRRRGEKAEFFVGSLAESLPEDVLSRLRLSSRLLRLEPRCGLFLDDDTALVCWHGRVFRISLPDRRIAEEHRFRPGMSSPLALVPVRDNPGFEDCVLYGEYINDGAENEIHIFRRASGSGVWAPVFSFEAGRIKHIHAIFSCPRRESLIVFTGDKDRESGIWEISRDFSGLRRILGGSQQFRAVAGFVTEDGIVYATDAPNEPNGLFFCDYAGGSRRRLAEIAGPAIYGAPLPGGRYVFSTSVEPERTGGCAPGSPTAGAAALRTAGVISIWWSRISRYGSSMPAKRICSPCVSSASAPSSSPRGSGRASPPWVSPCVGWTEKP